MSGRRIVVLLALSLLVCGTVLSQGEAQRVYQRGYDALLDENWGVAREAFDTVVRAYGDSSWAEGAQFWLCYLREKMGEPPESVFRCNEAFVNQYPKSNWANDARSNLIRIGRQLARAGKPEYEARVRSLRESQDDEVQLAALSALQRDQSDEAFDAVVNLFNRSRSEDVRARAVYVLGAFRTSKATSRLREITQSDRSERVRKEAVNALAQIAASAPQQDSTLAIPALLHMLTDESQPERVRQAIFLLARIRTSEVDNALAKVARGSRIAGIRRDAITALMRDDTACVPLFREAALKDEDLQVRWAALAALGRAKGSALAWNTLHELLGSANDPRVREGALQSMVSLAQMGSHTDVTRKVLLKYALEGSDKRMIRSIIQGVASVFQGREAGKMLAEVALQSKSREARKYALQISAAIEGAFSVDQLVGILKSENDSEMRRAAVVGLGSSRSDQAVPALVEAVRNDSDHRVRTLAVQALEIIGTPRAREAIVEIAGGKE
jgi:HEAT repeat protein